MQIIYCSMTQNRLSETRICIEKYLPYVDHIVIVDGGSVDDSVIYFRNWSQIEPKLHFYLHPWTDNFSSQRNNYLKRAKEFAQSGDWILVSDPDEVFEEETLKNLRSIASAASSKGYNSASFQCRSASLKGEKRVWESLDNYWKHLFYKWEPELEYFGNPHEGIRTKNGGLRILQTNFIYEHLKQENVIWPRGMRNSFIGGGGNNLGNQNPRWTYIRKLCKDKLDINDWHTFNKYLLQGDIDQELKQFIIECAFEGTSKASDKCFKKDRWDGASEWREWYKTYFRIYFPEQEPEYLKGKHIE